MDPKLDISTAGIPRKRSVGAISLFLRKSGSTYCDAAEPDHDVKEQINSVAFGMPIRRDLSQWSGRS
jgi:hypothetical protein